MSDMEKNAQIGELVLQREAAKIRLEHLKIKGNKIAAAYSTFGSHQGRWRADDATGRGVVFLSDPQKEDRNHEQYLLGQSELADHIRETAAAEVALAKINDQLSSLGISNS